MLRARTPLGGRAATPGGFVARGLARSLGVVSYPWAPQPRGMHIEERGGLRYLAGLARKVRLAPRGCGPCPCLAAATVCTCGCGAGPVSCCCAALQVTNAVMGRIEPQLAEQVCPLAGPTPALALHADAR